MKKFLALMLGMCLVLGSMACVAEGAAFVPGTYEGTGKGFGETVPVHVTITVDENGITAAEIEGDEEVPFGQVEFENYAAQLIGRADGEIDATTGATMTRDGVAEAVENALAQARGESADDAAEAAELAFTAGTYEATAEGYNGPLTVSVTYSDSAIESIDIVSSAETAHVGTVAFDIMIPEMLEANGAGVDGVSGATFSTRALRNAVLDTAEQAACTNLDAFKAAKIEHVAGDPIELSYDVVVVGAGGAGMAAAAQAAQNGNTVLVIEKNAEVGGNTLVSGGQYQSVMPYLVWDPADPDATTGVYEFDGQTYDKVKSVQGCIDELKMILDWSEEPFDADYYVDNEFVAGDAKELSKHGVHEEYLPVLKALKEEIQAYLDWAQPQLDAGTPENQLTLFSTLNLHIFQTYYGGLRQSADKSEWIYGDVDLVSQFIEGGQGLKEWLEAQGATFIEDTQPTLIGALWYRENEFIGSTIDLDGDGEPEMGRWGSYFAAPMSTIYAANEANNIMLRTTATDLIVEDGRVTGVKAVTYDGTEVTAKASKGVILTTGGYAANIDMVLENNVYWSTEYLSKATKTTNRSSLQGNGIEMAEAVGAATTGLGFTQLMPISWVDNGNLAFGGGNYACWINPTTGHRFVDEGSERDVLSLAEFRNGMEINGTKGCFLEFYNAEQLMPAPMQLADGDYEGRYYRRTIAELPELFEQLGVEADPEVVIQTIRDYDAAVMGQGDYPDVGKAIASRTVGNVELNEDGSYNVDSYDLDNTLLTIRLMAPSTHHTMGGVVVDTERHVLDADGNAIPGLYAAGEVTGGIHGGNRLGGNAIVEIFVSGRTAAQAVTADNE
ncbi:MAG: FAD-dependent oxidoreductase [Clostridia bacterium]|nr:FAD-dependent oxidoreductase [Clostridia bacterium]